MDVDDIIKQQCHVKMHKRRQRSTRAQSHDIDLTGAEYGIYGSLHLIIVKSRYSLLEIIHIALDDVSYRSLVINESLGIVKSLD